MERKIKPIAYIKTDFKEKFGIPRQSGRIKSAKGKIIFEPEYKNKEALKGLSDFSYIWLIFDFSLAHKEEFSPTVRPPRLGGNKKMGVFATRSPFRPNNLGLSSVKLESIAENGEYITVSGVDLLDGTPIYDIKPYIKYTDVHTEALDSFAGENQDHRLKITGGIDKLDIISKEKLETVIDCLCDDPRPSYQDDNRKYSMLFDNFDIHFTVTDGEITIIDVDKKHP